MKLLRFNKKRSTRSVVTKKREEQQEPDIDVQHSPKQSPGRGRAKNSRKKINRGSTNKRRGRRSFHRRPSISSRQRLETVVESEERETIVGKRAALLNTTEEEQRDDECSEVILDSEYGSTLDNASIESEYVGDIPKKGRVKSFNFSKLRGIKQKFFGNKICAALLYTTEEGQRDDECSEVILESEYGSILDNASIESEYVGDIPKKGRAKPFNFSKLKGINQKFVENKIDVAPLDTTEKEQRDDECSEVILDSEYGSILDNTLILDNASIESECVGDIPKNSLVKTFNFSKLRGIKQKFLGNKIDSRKQQREKLNFYEITPETFLIDDATYQCSEALLRESGCPQQGLDLASISCREALSMQMKVFDSLAIPQVVSSVNWGAFMNTVAFPATLPPEPSVQKVRKEDIVQWKFQKGRDERLGIVINQNFTKKGIYVTKIMPGSKCASSQLQAGMRILSINGIACPDTVEQTVELLSSTIGSIEIVAAKESQASFFNSIAGHVFGGMNDDSDKQKAVTTAFEKKNEERKYLTDDVMESQGDWEMTDSWIDSGTEGHSLNVTDEGSMGDSTYQDTGTVSVVSRPTGGFGTASLKNKNRSTATQAASTSRRQFDSTPMNTKLESVPIKLSSQNTNKKVKATVYSGEQSANKVSLLQDLTMRLAGIEKLTQSTASTSRRHFLSTSMDTKSESLPIKLSSQNTNNRTKAAARSGGQSANKAALLQELTIRLAGMKESTQSTASTSRRQFHSAPMNVKSESAPIKLSSPNTPLWQELNIKLADMKNSTQTKNKVAPDFGPDLLDLSRMEMDVKTTMQERKWNDDKDIIFANARKKASLSDPTLEPQMSTFAICKRRGELVGVSLIQAKFWLPGIYVDSVAGHSKFASSGLKAGMRIIEINQKACPETLDESIDIISNTDGLLQLSVQVGENVEIVDDIGVVSGVISKRKSSVVDAISKRKRFVTSTIYKRKHEPVGLLLRQGPKYKKGGIFIEQIKKYSKFTATPLGANLKVISINGRKCPANVKDCMDFIEKVDGRLTIEAEESKMP